MCGIIVSEKKENQLYKGLENIIKRGPDQTRIIEKDNHLFMFNRLSIMGLSETGMQPFISDDCIIVTNGEIYNYKEIKESTTSYQYASESDCEVLLPLYKELGTEMFTYLDAEFALVLYDTKNKSLIAARDPLGIRPLFYGKSKATNGIIFSSEVKGIIDFVDKVFPFPPGHYYINGEFIQFTNIYGINQYHNDTFDVIFKRINKKLTNAIIKRLDSDAPMGFLLSGGLDSSIVCAIAQRYLKTPIRTFSIGMKDDAIDLKYAKQVSEYIGSIHTEVIISRQDVINSLDEVIYALETYDITTIRASVGMYLLAKYIHNNTDIKVLLTGEVSDELFGYKYTDYAPNEAAFQNEADKRIRELYMYDVLRADRCLASNSLEARVPFGDIDFLTYVMKTPPIFKMNKYNMGKFLLRKSFEGELLPSNILYREKAAFSDAVGHSLVDILKEHSNSCYSDEEFLLLKQKYHNPNPFTKESLLYREIFEKHYKHHSHLVKNYWMPNKEWNNCNVDDPSARVLSNYGNSGN